MKNILAGTIGGGIFLFFYLALGGPLLFSLLSAIAGFGAVLLIGHKQKGLAVALGGIRDGEVKAFLQEMNEKMAAILSAAAKVTDGEVGKKVQRIGRSVENILNKVKAEPSLVKSTRRALPYYMDVLHKVVRRYDELEEHRQAGKEITLPLDKARHTLEDLHRVFEKHYVKLLQGDIFDLESEIKVLKKTMEMDGYAEEPTARPKP
ncbi:MAG: 5-bromo-4-chloroindolyl phosphate hydrolysis family protein [Syntrophaceae bacterium]|jgi:5-bromo-4-chloroindolyl phosphate hydrolysis protein|nr:5-bromo-4-chloroindolyl phosphate hydrolysis family protein [Syntrophaceae bacterium]